MRRPAAAIALAFLLALAGTAPALAAATASDAGSASAAAVPSAATGPSAALDSPDASPTDLGAGFAQTGDIAADTVVLRAEVAPDGDAQWRIAYRIELSDENTTAAFESLQADIRENTSAYVTRFEGRMGTTVAAAENATGREMTASNFSVTAQRNPFPTSTEYGVVAYTFTWEGFAATQGQRVVAGDALAGLYLDSGTVLTIAWPEEYDVRSVSPAADQRSETAVTWRGERNFGPDQPGVVLAPASALPIRPLYLAAAAVVLLGIAGAVILRRRGDFPIDAGDDLGPLVGDEGAVAATGSAAVDDRDEGGSTRDADDSASVERDAAGDAEGVAAADAEGVAANETAAGAAADATTPPDELLSPHERVLRLVTDNGGRMKQADVTDALDWSAARTSQVVGDLRDEGDIESFRLGRENVLRIPEADDEPHPGDTARGGDESGE
ncbi:helix-turn-helix transcriptional regulator [Halobaculum rarum]|uniref:helix-turn-helix transcriptional regulator n=1 Tax=Halobaculum rarum TaxID=3075122 RepID=UPI0032AEE0FF